MTEFVRRVDFDRLVLWISAPAISQHLKTLRNARLVRVRVEAQKRIYELDPAGVDELATWVMRVRSLIR